MNKKFLSAILFGALMVTSTGTFVSCKDYDDDIKELNGRVDNVESQIKDLQAKIDGGKWITNLTPTTGGFTVTFSDATSYTIVNGKDGAQGEAGVAGKDGAEWTITEDGFWACNGEKTTVKAVGENGKDAQPEVKKEDGKWFLWNGTEFEEIKVDAPAITGIPFYYVDPADPNYTVLVMFDENGENKKEIRLPMTSDLAQIGFVNGTENMAISFHKYTGTNKWGGDKALPAQGEYLIVQPTPSLLIQVTPANYDISQLEVKMVNAAGDEAPIVFGTPVPFSGIVSSRAVSQSGIYEIPYSAKDFSAETIKAWEDNFKGQSLSLVANASVRSTYVSALVLKDPALNDMASIKFTSPSVNRGETAYVGAYQVVSQVNKSAEHYIYDAFLTTADAQSKADSIKCGVKTDGRSVTAEKDCAIKFNVNYVNAWGHVKKTATQEQVTVTFGAPAVEVTTDEVTFAAVSHQSTSKVADQNMFVNLKEYFEKFAATETDRAIWNADASFAFGADIKGDGASVKATWEHKDDNGDIVVTDLTDLISGITMLDKDKNPASDNAAVKAKATQLKLAFGTDYGTELAKFEDGTVTVYATVTLKDNNEGDAYAKHIIAIPVEIKNPTQADIDKQYSFNANYFNSTSRVLTVTTATANLVTLQNNQAATANGKAFFYATGDNKAKLATGLQWVSGQEGKQVKLATGGKNGVEYAISNGKVKFLGTREFTISSFKVKFANAAENKFVSGKSLVIANSGTIILKYLTNVDADNAAEAARYFSNYRITDYAGSTINIATPSSDTTISYEVYVDGIKTDPATTYIKSVKLLKAANANPAKDNDLTIEAANLGNTQDKAIILKAIIDGNVVNIPVTIAGTAAN